ncbi:MAG: hypothetical protein SFY80_04015 [Verrucomicrobiota bacterium]|nr:hypothetical protein [Verrucomicrobiota bacterium]
MKLTLPLLILGFAAPLMAGNLTVTVTPYQKASGFLADRNFRFLQTEAYVSPNAATHILIEGLLPASTTNANLVSSAYTAINIDTGVEQDAGYVTLELPASTPEAGVVTSPIVGIVQRAGAWSAQTLTPVTSNIGGSTGASSYDSTAKTLALTLSRSVNGSTQNISGSANYTITDANTVTLAPFSLTVNAATFDFAQTVLKRNGTTFSGELSANLAPANFDADSALYFLSLIDSTDSDGDGIPDLADSAIAPPPTSILGTATGPNQFYVTGAGFKWQEEIGHVYDGFYPFVFVFSSANWIYIFAGDSTEAGGYFIYDFNKAQFGYTGYDYYPWYAVVPLTDPAVYVDMGAP